MIGTLDDLHVMFDDEDGMTPFDEGVESLKQSLDIVEVQTCCRLVEDKQGGLLLLLTDEVGEFHTLVLTAGEGRGVLPQLDVSEPHFFQCLQSPDDGLGHLSCLLISLFPCLLEEVNGLRDGHVQHVVDVLPVKHHIEDVSLETVPVTSFTLQHEVGHELHLYRDHTGTLTLLAAAAFGVEREILGRESHLLRQRLLCIEVADGIIGLHIGGGVRTGRLADGVLVYELHMLHGVDVSTDAEVFARQVADFAEMTLEGGVEDAFDEARLA